VGSIAFADLSHESASVPITAFDSWENICWSFEKTRLDNFAIHLQQDTSYLGYIVVYAGRESCADEAVTRALRAKKWLEKRGVPANRILWTNGGFREHTETQLWVWPLGEGPFPVDSKLKPSEVRIVNSCRGKILNPAKCK
jgi:hypothetical protein